MTSLATSQINVLRARGMIRSGILIVAAALAEVVIFQDSPLPAGLLGILAMIATVLLTFVLPGRRYRSWSYDVGEDELYVQQGIWVRTRTIVPFGRVQHIDVSQGPIERRYGVGVLTLHTAGTRSSAVYLPGLEMAQAEGMRDDIRGKIRQDLA